MPDILRFDLLQRAKYSQGAGIYRILPTGVGHPATLSELRELLADAVANGWSITPRGAGSAMDGSNLGGGLVVDLSGFDADRCLIDPRAATAMVTPSLTLGALNRAASVHGLRLPPDPSSGAWATLGGMLSTNASGARTVRYGSVRRWVRALTLETAEGPLTLARNAIPDPVHPIVRRWQEQMPGRLAAASGEILQRFPAVSKNSAGFALDQYLTSGDLMDLVIGSEGSLGIVTAIEWQLDPIPPCRVSLRLMVGSREGLVPVIAALRQANTSSIEFLDRTFLAIIDPALAGEAAPLIDQAGGVILSDIEGSTSAEVLERANRALAEAQPWILHGLIATDPQEIDTLWQIRHGASPALARLDDGRRSLQVIEDGAVPWPRLPEYLAAVERICAEVGIAVVLFGHAGDGHVHANLLPRLLDPDWHARVTSIYRAVTAEQLRLGGTVSGEHGAGRLRAGLLDQMYGPTIMALMRSVKQVFDPAGRFNPGVIISDGTPALSQLKVGSEMATLPPAAEEWLRGMEEGARWGESRWDRQRSV